MNNQNTEIANTILEQMGGTGKIAAMTGAKDFVAINNGVQFKVGKNSKSINFVRITLNASDLYNVEYGRIAKKRGEYVPTLTVKSTEDDIYNDMLKASFERNTGLYLTF